MNKEYIGTKVMSEEMLAVLNMDDMLDLKDEHLTYVSHMKVTEILSMCSRIQLN